MSLAIPQGLEVLVRKASVDPEFKALLLAQRAAAAETIGLALAPAEAMMLAAVPAAQLEAIIARTTVPQEHRRTFLGQAAAAMLAALGALGSEAEAVAKIMPAPGGAAPDRPPPPVSRGIQPDRPPATFGIQPDAPPADPTRPSVEQRVVAIVAKQFSVEAKQVTREKSFVQDYKANAAHLVKLKEKLEKEFQITIGRDEFKKAQTVGGAIACVEQALAKKKPAQQPPAQPQPLPAPQRPDRLPALGGSRPSQPPPGGLGGARP